MDTARQAALLLHAMSPSDRRWVSDRLDAEETRRLTPMRDELPTLGFARVRGLRRGARGEEGGPAEPPPPQTIHSAAASAEAPTDPALDVLRNLDRKGVRCLAAILEQEPPALVSGFLAIEDWSYRERLLRRFPPDFRRELEAEPGSTLTDAMRTRLIAHLTDVFRMKISKQSARRGHGPLEWVKVWRTRRGNGR